MRKKDTTCLSQSPAGPSCGLPSFDLCNLINLKLRVRAPKGCSFWYSVKLSYKNRSSLNFRAIIHLTLTHQLSYKNRSSLNFRAKIHLTLMHQSVAVPPPPSRARIRDSGGIAGLKYLRGVPVVPWLCRAFDSHQNSRGNSGAFLQRFTGL